MRWRRTKPVRHTSYCSTHPKFSPKSAVTEGLRSRAVYIGAAVDNGIHWDEWVTVKETDEKDAAMKVLLALIAWCILLVLCWPLAVLALILFPVVWLLSLPLRLIGITVKAVFALIRALLFLPARLLGYRRGKCQG
jgi:hypothetical protein